MSTIVNINSRSRKASIARVSAMQKSAVAYLNKEAKEQAEKAERDRWSNQIAINLTTEMRKAYACLGPERAKTIIDLAHSAALADQKIDTPEF